MCTALTQSIPVGSPTNHVCMANINILVQLFRENGLDNVVEASKGRHEICQNFNVTKFSGKTFSH